jgi:hypothetical protein
MAIERDAMMKIFGTLLFSGAVLAGSAAMADNDKRTSGRDGVQCIDGGERECGIAWEGKGLFNISARANYAFTQIWDEDLDLQQAYLCCTEDQTRKNICAHSTWITWDHCEDYVMKFFDPDNESRVHAAATFFANRMEVGIVYPQWIERIRKLNEDILDKNPNSASARSMQSCMDQASNFWSTGAKELVEQAGEFFDVVTIIDAGYLGSLFIDKAITPVFRTVAKDGLKEAETAFFTGLEEVTTDDVRMKGLSEYADVLERRMNLLNKRLAKPNGIERVDKELKTIISNIDYLLEQKEENRIISLDFDVDGLEKNDWAFQKFSLAQENLLSSAPERIRDKLIEIDEKIYTYLYGDYLEGYDFTRLGWKMQNDLNYTYGVRRDGLIKFLNKDVSLNGYDTFSNDIAESLSLLNRPFAGSKTTPAALESLHNILSESSKEAFQERFKIITELRYAKDGTFEENMNAVKLGYWKDVRGVRLGVSEAEVDKIATKVAASVGEQIDEIFMKLITEEQKYVGRELSEEETVAVLERRLREASFQEASDAFKKEQNLYAELKRKRIRNAFITGAAGVSAAAFTYMTEHPSEGCIAAIFDTLRDESNCLWNHAEGEFCDE